MRADSNEGHLGGHSTAATRNESINDIIARMNGEWYGGAFDSIRVPVAAPCQIDDLDPLAAFDDDSAAGPVHPPAPGPATILGTFVRILQRARWALYRNQGRAARSWSTGERLSVALVLGDRPALAELGYTPAEAADAVSAVLALPPNEIDRWVDELRAVL